MRKVTTCRSARGRYCFCLLLAFVFQLNLPAQPPFGIEICPEYPRAMDQVFVCYHLDEVVIKENATLHNPVRFTFPGLPPDVTVTFDAADGNGPSNIGENTIISATYPAPGQYHLNWTMNTAWGNFSGTITFQTNFNPDFPYADNPNHFSIPSTSLNVDTYTPSPGGAYPPGSPNTAPVTAGGIVHVLYANPDHQLRKPFILVEGFDPIIGPADEYVVNDLNGNVLGFGDVRWDVVTTGRNESFDVDPNEPGVPHTPQFNLFPTLLSGLRNRGYDIVYVDFANGGTYLQANAEFLIGVLEWVNASKVTDEENVLLGASMGGIIGRYALAKLESEGKSHCTGLYFSLDSPHNGANIPYSLQALGWYFHASGNTDEAWNAMETPAARQMLIKHLGAAVQDGDVTPVNIPLIYTTPLDFSELSSGADYSFLKNQLKSELDGFGWPKFPRKVALSDGMKNGTLSNGQGFGPGEKFYESRAYATGLDLGTVFRLFMRANNGGGTDYFSINGMDDCLEYQASSSIYDHLFTICKPHDLNPCFGKQVPYKYHVMSLLATGDLPFLDNAPGGFRMDMRAVHSKLKTELGASTDYQNPVNLPVVTFVPTWSALAMGTALTNDNLFVDLTTPEFGDGKLPNAKIPNFDNFYAPSTSLRHVELDGGMIDLILQETDGLEAAPQAGTLTEVYNYGKQHIEIPNTTVSATGILNINNPGPTGFVQSNPQGNAVKPSFTTYLNACGQIITVEAGGQYNIGALDKSQHGVTEVWDGATVHIKSGGILHITSDQSGLVIKHGATLILDAGAVVRLESPGSAISIFGDLVVNGDIIFGGLGYFDFAEGNHLVFGPGYSTFNLTGAAKANRFVRLSADVLLDQAHRLNWSRGKLDVAGGSILLADGAGLDFNLMTLSKDGGGSITAIEADGSGLVNLTDCKVEQLDMPIHGTGGLGCRINLCEFSQYYLGVVWANAFSTFVSNSVFDGGHASGTSALQMTDIGILSLSYNQFFDHHDPFLTGIVTDGDLSQGIPAVNLDNLAVCLVKGCTFSGNSIGIKSDNPLTGATANVFAYGGTGFYQNTAGIYVVGDATKGAVLADCVSFEENRNGIRGRDIALMIDSWNSKVFAFDTDSPNHFIRLDGAGPGGTERHVRICYGLKTAVGSSSNLMRNNFWGITNGGIPTADPTPLVFLDLLDAACVPNGVVPTLAPIAPRNTACPLDQRPESFVQPFPGSECMTVVSNEGGGMPVRVHEQFHLGTFLMKADSAEAGIEAMRPVAALWQPDLSAYPDNCRQYISVAKAFVDALDDYSPGLNRPGAERVQTASAGLLLIAPNPASDVALVQLPAGAQQVRIWDAYGRVWLQTAASGTCRIETGTWKPGVYYLEALSAEGSRRSGKLVVQR